MKRSAAALLLAVLLSDPAVAQEAAVKPGGEGTITIRGFISGTMFLQDQAFGFGNGQNAEWASLGEFAEGAWILGGDVRNTRVALAFLGPEIVAGWRAGGTLEMDFFGGFVNTGPFGDEQPQPRLRLAYADLTRGGTTLRIGQAWSPLFGYVPVSLSHIAFPLGWGAAGAIGWRFPGVFLYQNITPTDAPVAAQLQLAAMRGSWTAAPGLVTDNLSPGEAAVVPQVEARLDLSGKLAGDVPWSAFVVGHYDQKDLSGAGTRPARGGEDHLIGTAFEVGARVVPGPLTLHGNLYFAEAVGQHLAHITQFGEISGWGAWAQAGYALDPRWSVWAFYGVSDPDDRDVIASVVGPLSADVTRRDGRLRNQLFNAMLRFSSGPYALGLEWLRADTDWASRFLGPGGLESLDRLDRSGNQIALSVLYTF